MYCLPGRRQSQIMNTRSQKILKEVTYQSSRSGGKGGQNVNKVSTKVELCFDVASSLILNAEEKQLIFEKLQTRINSDGMLKLVSQEERTQLLNKKKVNEKFILLLEKCLAKRKKRIPITLPETIKEERLMEKKKITAKKKLRQLRDLDL